MTTDIQKSYKEIFETYLNFNRHYRRNLIDLSEMYDWLDDIDLRKRFFFAKYDFFILMEWFNSISLIKPLAVLSYSTERFKDVPFKAKTNSSELKKLYEEGLISFPEDIYKTNNKSHNDVIPWEYRVYKPEVNEEKDYRIFNEYDLDYYLYHPIQFFQLLTYLRGSTYKNLMKKKEYKEFYWKRRLTFNDSLTKKNEEYLEEKKLSKDQYIKEKSDKGSSFHQIELIYYKQHRWLIEKALLMWIKFESIYHTEFLRPSNSRGINIELQVSLWDSNKEEIFETMVKEYNEWSIEVMENFSEYFSIDEFTVLKGFITWTEIQLKIDGLDNFKDLFLLIDNEKKSKLKGFVSFFVNMLQIVKTLRFFSAEFIKAFLELEKEKTDPKWYEPKYLFESEEDKTEYIQKVYLDYGLTQEDTYILYVEGPTEEILLKDWLDFVYYTIKVKINVKTLPAGKSSANFFPYLASNFNANEHFLILDRDTPSYAEGKKNELKGKGISDESFYIFSPDFITANFEPTEIIEALKLYFDDISKKIHKSTGQREFLTETDLIDFKTNLENKEEFDKYEKIVENYLSIKLQKVKFKLKKTKFAKHLLSVMRENFSQSNRSKKYPFEEIIGKFASKIQNKKFPRLEMDT